MYFLEAYNHLTKNSEKYSARIFEDVYKFTTQNCNKKIQKFKVSVNIKALEIFSGKILKMPHFIRFIIKF